jgi:hypothetical protein
LYFHINPSTKGYIDAGLSIGYAIDSFADTADKFVNNVKTMNPKGVEKYVNVNNGMDECTQVLSIASAAISAVNATQAAAYAVTSPLQSALN